MNQNSVLDHLTTIKRDIEYINSVLSDRIPENNSGRPMVEPPHIEIEQAELNQITEISKLILVKMSEISNTLNHDSWKPYIQHPLEYGGQLYAIVLQLNDSQFFYANVMFEPLSNLRKSILELEIQIKVYGAISQGSASKKQYSETQVTNQINEVEKMRRESRLKTYRKMDQDLKTLLDSIQTDQPKVLDRTVSKLLYLVGFDTEIYDPYLSGNIDVIAVDRRYGIICIIENTTRKITKSKIDQIIGHQKEYEKEYESWENSKVYPILICTKNDAFADALAQQHATYNLISIITNNELKELIKYINKGKISPTLFVKYIKNKIPKNDKWVNV